MPQGSVAPQVQLAQAPSPQLQPAQNVAPVPRSQVLPGAPAPGFGKGLFGSNIAEYPKFDPNADPDLIQKGIKQGKLDLLQGQISRPSMNFFQGGTVQKMADEAAQLAGEISEIDKRLQEKKNNQLKADNANVPRNQQTATQNNDTIIANLEHRMRTGDPSMPVRSKR